MRGQSSCLFCACEFGVCTGCAPLRLVWVSPRALSVKPCEASPRVSHEAPVRFRGGNILEFTLFAFVAAYFVDGDTEEPQAA